MIDKIKLYVCENYAPEFIRICENNNDLADVIIIPYPSICINRNKREETSRLLASVDSEGVVFCSKRCDILSLIPTESAFETHLGNYCFTHLASEPLLNYVLAKGGYVIGSGWLKNWRERIMEAGFDRDTARRFYQEFCKELVFFDSGIDANVGNDLTELSQFLDLPYIVVPFELDSMRLIVNTAVTERRLRVTKSEARSEMEAQYAEYAAIFDLMSKISVYANKRDIIEKVKEIFFFVFGAQQFMYWNNDYENDSMPEEISILLFDKARDFLLIKEENRFCIKIKWHEKIFGTIDVSGFMFPQYLEKYLNFAIEIVKICGLVFSNNEQYEKILKSEQEQRYSSTHDALTDLYNRTYINEILGQISRPEPYTVFMFDIDRLKFVNDHYGHTEGDKLITNVAKILKKSFRENEIVARIGGDEFVAIIQGMNQECAVITENRIRQQIEIHNDKNHDENLKISFSIGYAVGDASDDTIESLMNKADEFMYAEKMRRRRESDYQSY